LSGLVTSYPSIGGRRACEDACRNRQRTNIHSSTAPSTSPVDAGATKIPDKRGVIELDTMRCFDGLRGSFLNRRSGAGDPISLRPSPICPMKIRRVCGSEKVLQCPRRHQ